MKYVVIFLLLMVACTASDPEVMELDSKTFLALGDSYTIGEAVDETNRWPIQLYNKLLEEGIKLDSPRIIATTGWTTSDLLYAIDNATIDENYSMVSLLIGVNNQYRGYPISQYEDEFQELLNKAITFAGGDPKNVFIISIPDYGVTPFARNRNLDAAKIAMELDQYNEIAESIAQTKNVSFTNITEDSRKAEDDTSYIATDGLHPSGRMYSEWVQAVYGTVYDNLSSR
jgi:lysophospholipase L1-like esterase